MRERRIGKLMAPASKHRAASRPEHARANYASRHLHSGRGAGSRNFSRLPVRGRAFSLDILFYRTKRLRVRDGMRRPVKIAVTSKPVLRLIVASPLELLARQVLQILLIFIAHELY